MPCYDVQVVSILLEAGSSVNAIDTDGCTALHLAAQDGHMSIAKLLLRHGAIADACERQGKTAQALAEEHDHPEIVAALKAWQAQVKRSAQPCTQPKSYTLPTLYFEVHRPLGNSIQSHCTASRQSSTEQCGAWL